MLASNHSIVFYRWCFKGGTFHSAKYASEIAPSGIRLFVLLRLCSFCRWAASIWRTRDPKDALVVPGRLLHVYPYYRATKCVLPFFSVYPTISSTAYPLPSALPSLASFLCITGLPELLLCVSICSGVSWSRFSSLMSGTLHSRGSCALLFLFAAGAGGVLNCRCHITRSCRLRTRPLISVLDYCYLAIDGTFFVASTSVRGVRKCRGFPTDRYCFWDTVLVDWLRMLLNADN